MEICLCIVRANGYRVCYTVYTIQAFTENEYAYENMRCKFVDFCWLWSVLVRPDTPYLNVSMSVFLDVTFPTGNQQIFE